MPKNPPQKTSQQRLQQGAQQPTAAQWWQRHLLNGTDLSDLDLGAGNTLPDIWCHNWSAEPEREVIHDAKHGWLNAGQLAQSVELTSQKLRELGVSTGDRVLLSAPNSSELVVAHVALLLLGAVIVPINPGYQRNEVIQIVHRTAPVVALASDEIRVDWDKWIAEARHTTVPIWSDVVEICREPANQSPNTNARKSTQAAEISPHSGALLIFTSGSTGSPKAALLSQANLLASVRSIELAWRWSSDDTLLLTLPLSHMHGLGVGLYGTLTTGARLVLQDGFEAATALAAIKTHSATMFFGVPTIYTRLLESGSLAELASLRLCVCGSAPLSVDTHHEIFKKTGHHILERYGMTETAMLVSNPYDGERRPGTIGFPLPGVEVRLAEETNEIQVRGPSVFAGYWNADQASATAQTTTQANNTFVDGDWFCTGDVGEISADGYVSIVGRLKEIIITGGFNVHPREVEETICQHPGVSECAIAGEPDNKWGEVVAAYVVLEKSTAAGSQQVDLAELREFLVDRLANYKRPQRCYVLAELPRNALGKVQRHLLSPDAASTTAN